MSIRKPIPIAAMLCWLAAAASVCAAPTPVFDLRGAAAEQALAELRPTIESEPANFEALRDAGIILHQLARAEPGDEDLVEEGEGYLKRARKLRPKDLHTQAWLGSITTMKARFVSDPGKQTFFVKLGTRMMDRALHQAPDDPVLRLIRGHNSMELPVFLKRTRFAVEDFDRYLALCQTVECPAHEQELAETRLQEARDIVAGQQ